MKEEKVGCGKGAAGARLFSCCSSKIERRDNSLQFACVCACVCMLPISAGCVCLPTVGVHIFMFASTSPSAVLVYKWTGCLGIMLCFFVVINFSSDVTVSLQEQRRQPRWQCSGGHVALLLLFCIQWGKEKALGVAPVNISPPHNLLTVVLFY